MAGAPPTAFGASGDTAALPDLGPEAPREEISSARRGGTRRAPASRRLGLKVAAVAGGAVVAVGAGAVAALALGGEPDAAAETGTVASAPLADPAPAPDPAVQERERKRLAQERKELAHKRASREARGAAEAPRLRAKGTPIPTETPTPKPRSGGGGGGAPTGGGDPVPAGEAQAIAKSMLPSFGFSGGGQFGCLVKLWNKESGWRHTAANPSSGAYGIPQALPGSKMASAGSDWRSNPRTQIKWGLGYIKNRYGTPCGAWGHSQRVGWY
ncbi:lytic transglycosylase domain-containing protein [Actinomadura flavalba]|uniref:aggregation-promoting factor C-terminal-like domain-containing protein n=1 Tax=Actinomadura flavalba TaxID=1120938 RepID=UPI00038072F0|nr:lytic transglycosylase domain-containing protein [Actinomadura flavalba]